MKKNKAFTTVLLSVFIVFVAQINNTFLEQNIVQTPYKVLALANQFGNPQLHVTNIGDSQEQFNITLRVRDWKNETDLRNLNVTIWDLEEKIYSSYLTGESGQVDLFFLDTGQYIILVQDEYRIVGYQKIIVTENAKHTIRTWSYNLNVTLVDENGASLANHTVFLYDQMIFHSYNYSLTSETVELLENYTVVTDNIGSLVSQAETNENGTVSFTNVWNGTYRLRVIGKEEWVEEYILGELVLTLREPAAGEHILNLQESANITLKCVRADLRLQFVSGSNVPLPNATIYTRNTQGHLYSIDQTNSTGFVEQKNVYVIDEVYEVSALYGDRTVGYRVIEVSKTDNFTIKCWTNNITITCLDWNAKPLANHPVLLYDQLVFHSPNNITVVTNQTDFLINWTRTNENGMAYFNDVFNGTYWIEVRGGETIGEAVISLQKPEFITIYGDKTFMSLTFVAQSGEPLSGATIFVYDEDNNLVFRERTLQNGSIFREGMYVDAYNVYLEYKGKEVWSDTVNIHQEKGRTIECAVYRLTLHFLDPFRNSIPKAEVTVTERRWIPSTRTVSGHWVYAKILDLETDETGHISSLLPQGSYVVTVSAGIYDVLQVINLDMNYETVVNCNVKLMFWLLLSLVFVPLLLFTLLFERRKLRKPLEIRKHQGMLSKLESMYQNGLVEYQIYRKLREEYEATIMELGGREKR